MTGGWGCARGGDGVAPVSQVWSDGLSDAGGRFVVRAGGRGGGDVLAHDVLDELTRGGNKKLKLYSIIVGFWIIVRKWGVPTNDNNKNIDKRIK